METTQHTTAFNGEHTRSTASSVLLHANGLRIAFGGQVVLNNVDLALHRGEVVLLRGANGSGKTTLLNILTGNQEPDVGQIRLHTKGAAKTFHFPRRWWHRLNTFNRFAPERVAKKGVGRTWQEIRLFSTQSLRDNIAVASRGQLGESPVLSLLRRGSVRAEEQHNRRAATALLDSLGLGGRSSSSADKVSLGQSKRVAIARAVRAGARVLFLDEPLAGLDSAGIADVLALLERLAREEGITLVIIEHVFNIPHILPLASTVWTLNSGALHVEAPKDLLVSESPSRESLDAWLRNLAGANSTIEDHPLPGGATLSVVTPAATTPGEIVLEVNDLVVHRGRRLVIGHETADIASETAQGLTFRLRRNQLGVLQAPNGWGKTTLLETLAGLQTATSGSAWICGRRVDSLPAWERPVSLLQSRDQLFPSLSVSDTLRLAGVRVVPRYLGPVLDRQVGSLSGGEKQKVALACSVEGRPFEVGLWDEPLSALDHAFVTDEAHHLFGASRPVSLIAVPSTLAR